MNREYDVSYIITEHGFELWGGGNQFFLVFYTTDRRFGFTADKYRFGKNLPRNTERQRSIGNE